MKTLHAAIIAITLASCGGSPGNSKGKGAPPIFRGTVRVVAIHVQGPDGYSEDQALERFSAFQDIMIERAGVRVELVEYRSVDRPELTIDAEVKSQAGRNSHLEQLKHFIDAEGVAYRNAPNILFLFLLPPHHLFGGLWHGGTANGICALIHKRLPIAYAAGGPVNHRGEDRLSWLPIILAHELGHLIGMQHRDALVNGLPSIMHRNALEELDEVSGFEEAEFLEVSLLEAKTCIEGGRENAGARNGN